MMSKQLVTVALLVTLAAVAVNASSLTAGSRKPGDFEELPAAIIQFSAVGGQPAILDHTAEMNPNVITQIFAEDLDNKGATARITSGGPGSESVSVNFQSPIGEGLNYVLHTYVMKA